MVIVPCLSDKDASFQNVRLVVSFGEIEPRPNPHAQLFSPHEPSSYVLSLFHLLQPVIFPYVDLCQCSRISVPLVVVTASPLSSRLHPLYLSFLLSIAVLRVSSSSAPSPYISIPMVVVWHECFKKFLALFLYLGLDGYSYRVAALSSSALSLFPIPSPTCSTPRFGITTLALCFPSCISIPIGYCIVCTRG